MKKYSLMAWFIKDDYPSLLTMLLLWIWKRNKFIESILLFLLVIIQFSMTFIYFILMTRKLGYILSIPLWMYLNHIFFKYISESQDEARKIYKKSNH